MTDDFVPEADAIEQHQEVAPEDDTGSVIDTGVDTDEAEEADVLEQSQVVPDDEGHDGA